LDIEQHVRYLVTADVGQRGHSSWCICEDLGVNTSPSTNDQKWYIAYTFYDSAGTLIGQTKLPINQSVATSTGWVADTNAVGATSLPRAAWKLIVSFVGGKNATGTVWADDFLFTGRGGQWAGQDWNTSVGVPTGWYYWLPPNGGNDALLSNGFENTVVTSEAAHTGQYSLKFSLPAGRTAHDGFVGTKRYALKLLWGTADFGRGEQGKRYLGTPRYTAWRHVACCRVDKSKRSSS